MPVYILQAGNTDMVKIGWAEDVESRRAGLQTGHYEELRIIRVIETTAPAERWLHRHFAAQHVRNEWFRFHPEMLTIEPPTIVVSAEASDDPILGEIESFLVDTGMNATAFGRHCLGDPTLVHELRKGRECRWSTRMRIKDFIHRSLSTPGAPLSLCEVSVSHPSSFFSEA